MARLRMSPAAIVPSPAEPQMMIWMSVLSIAGVLVVLPEGRVDVAALARNHGPEAGSPARALYLELAR